MASNHMENNFSPETEGMSTPGSGVKRTAPDGGIGTRSKRNRYISIACNECKRRKIKCNGQTPCQRCGNLSLECLYAPNCSGIHLKDTEDFQQMRDQIANLQDQVNVLFNNFAALKHQDTGAPSDGYSRHGISPNNPHQPMSFNSIQTRPPPLYGPNSVNYGLDVAKHSLATMGITPENGMEDGAISDQQSPERSIDPELTASPHHEKDPLWSMKRQETIDLVRMYDEEIGVTYPMLDVEKVIKHINMLYTFMEAALRTGFVPPHLPGADALDDEDTNILKLVLATIRLFIGNGSDELGEKLFKSVEPQLERKLWAPAEPNGIKMIALASMHYFHKDDEVQSWRLIGIAGRMCMELGMHRQSLLERSFPEQEERRWALRVFWTIHSFDRRWSIGTGLPFSIPDADVDPLLPLPEGAYPRAMYGFHNLVSKIWYSSLVNEAQPKREEMEFLDYQVRQWYEQVAPELRFDRHNIEEASNRGARGARRLRILLYMRTNSARLSIYRPILYSATSIMENRDYAQTAVDVAKDTISLLTHVNQISDLYRTQQVRFNHFLVSALAALFLAVCHAPAEFNRDVREEFFMALDLIKGFSADSTTSKKLWKAIRGLRAIGQKLGLLKPNDEGDPHSDAALAMAGLSGQPVQGISYNTSGAGFGELDSSPFDGLQMSNELTNLFEMAGKTGNGYALQGSDQLLDSAGLQSSYSNGLMQNGDSLPVGFASEEEFSRLMGEIF